MGTVTLDPPQLRAHTHASMHATEQTTLFSHERALSQQ